MEKLFERVLTGVVILVTIAMVFSFAVVPVWYLVETSRQPYTQGDAVVIKANGLPAVVQSKGPTSVSVSYVDDFGHMSEAELLYSQVEPAK